MSNIIFNVVIAPRPVLEALLDEAGEVDFARVSPLPPHLRDLDSSAHGDPRLDQKWAWVDEHWWAAKGWDPTFEDEPDPETGWPVLRFWTKNEAPVPVFAALSAKFPADEVRVRYADSDAFGYAPHDIRFKGGATVVDYAPESDSPEAMELASQVVYGVSYEVAQAADRELPLRQPGIVQFSVDLSDIEPEIVAIPPFPDLRLVTSNGDPHTDGDKDSRKDTDENTRKDSGKAHDEGTGA